MFADWADDCPESGCKKVKNFFVNSLTSKNPVRPPHGGMDFLNNSKEELSVYQQRFMTRVNETTKHLKDQHYEMALPIKNPQFKFPNNKIQVPHRKQIK